MSAIVALVGFLLLVFGLITVIKPIPALYIPNRKRAVLMITAGLVIIGATGAVSSEPSKIAKNSTSDELAVVHVKASPQGPSLPPKQEAFIEAAMSGRLAFRQAANDMAKGGTRAERKKAVTSVLDGLTIDEWIGKIKKLGANSEGKGVLAVSLNDFITLATWNNALSDLGSQTLIPPDSTLFQKVSSLQKGDMVIFSGSFFRSDVDGIEEQSMTLSGSMLSPEYVFRFESVERYEGK